MLGTSESSCVLTGIVLSLTFLKVLVCLSTVTSQRLVLKQEEGELEAYAVRKVRPTYTVLCILSTCIFY